MVVYPSGVKQVNYIDCLTIALLFLSYEIMLFIDGVSITGIVATPATDAATAAAAAAAAVATTAAPAPAVQQTGPGGGGAFAPHTGRHHRELGTQDPPSLPPILNNDPRECLFRRSA